MKIPTRYFCAPFVKYGVMEAIQYRDPDHTPYNKRPGSVDSVLQIEASRMLGGDAVSISMEEITTTKNWGTGAVRTAGRTISASLPLAEAEKLACFILDACQAARNAKQKA